MTADPYCPARTICAERCRCVLKTLIIYQLHHRDSCDEAMRSRVCCTSPANLTGIKKKKRTDVDRAVKEKPRFSLPFQLFSQRLFCDSERQIPRSRKSITFIPIWIRDHWWSACPPPPPPPPCLAEEQRADNCWSVFKGTTTFVRASAGCFGTEWKHCTQRGCAACGRESMDTGGKMHSKGSGRLQSGSINSQPCRSRLKLCWHHHLPPPPTIHSTQKNIYIILSHTAA